MGNAWPTAGPTLRQVRKRFGDVQALDCAFSVAPGMVSTAVLRGPLPATENLYASVPGSGTVIYGGDPDRVTTAVGGDGVVIER